jgi:hypothetical protein
MVLVLLQDHEHAGRRAVAGLAGGAGGHADLDAVAVDVDELVRDRDDEDDRALRREVRLPDELAGLERAGVDNAASLRVGIGDSGRSGEPGGGERQEVAAIE